MPRIRPHKQKTRSRSNKIKPRKEAKSTKNKISDKNPLSQMCSSNYAPKHGTYLKNFEIVKKSLKFS